MSNRCIFASQKLGDLVVRQLDIRRTVVIEDRQLDRTRSRRYANTGCTPKRHHHRRPFGESFEHNNAVLNSPGNIHALIIHTGRRAIKMPTMPAAQREIRSSGHLTTSGKPAAGSKG